MKRPVVAVEFTMAELLMLRLLTRNETVWRKLTTALEEIRPLVTQYNSAKKAARKKPCPVKCPCICHDTGGADYGMHGGGHCKGVATDDWVVVDS